MTEVILWLIAIAVVLNVVTLSILVRRSRDKAFDGLLANLVDELRSDREESTRAFRDLREELASGLKAGNDSITATLTNIGQLQLSQLGAMTKQLRELTESNQNSLNEIRGVLDLRLQALQEGNEKKLEESTKVLREFREELGIELKKGNETIGTTLGNMGHLQQQQLDGLTKHLKELTESNQNSLNQIRDTLDSRVQTLQEGNERKLEESTKALRELREEVAIGLKAANDTISAALANQGEIQRIQLESLTTQLRELTQSNQNSLDQIRSTLDLRVQALQDGNEKKLEEMRHTVDEKLQNTLEKRLGESFKLVSEQLEAVHYGLGEMQNLATGVGDLKRVLTNVKTRGTWAEVQLGAILEQMMAQGQYARNVRTKEESDESVEYAIRLPGLKGVHGQDQDDLQLERARLDASRAFALEIP